MKIGFTGTQKGMSKHQKEHVIFHIMELQPIEVHYGMCIGADDEMYNIIKNCFPNCKIIGHPPINKSKYAHRECDEYRQPKEYLIRNHDIVDETDLLIACPFEDDEVLRSGTWATIRYGKKKLGKNNVIIIERGQ